MGRIPVKKKKKVWEKSRPVREKLKNKGGEQTGDYHVVEQKGSDGADRRRGVKREKNVKIFNGVLSSVETLNRHVRIEGCGGQVTGGVQLRGAWKSWK